MITQGKVGIIREPDKRYQVGGFFLWKLDGATSHGLTLWKATTDLFWLNRQGDKSEVTMPDRLRLQLFGKSGKETIGGIVALAHLPEQLTIEAEQLSRQRLIFEIDEILDYTVDAVNDQMTVHVLKGRYGKEGKD